jgi:hypothetical protein
MFSLVLMIFLNKTRSIEFMIIIAVNVMMSNTSNACRIIPLLWKSLMKLQYLGKEHSSNKFIYEKCLLCITAPEMPNSTEFRGLREK